MTDKLIVVCRDLKDVTNGVFLDPDDVDFVSWEAIDLDALDELVVLKVALYVPALGDDLTLYKGGVHEYALLYLLGRELDEALCELVVGKLALVDHSPVLQLDTAQTVELGFHEVTPVYISVLVSDFALSKELVLFD